MNNAITPLKFRSALLRVSPSACLALLLMAGAVYGDTYRRTPNAAISGHNTRSMTGSVAQCQAACSNETSFDCKSFDYDKANHKCDLSDKSASDVGGLKTDYAGDPYDNYERVVAGSTSNPNPQPTSASGSSGEQCVRFGGGLVGYVTKVDWYKPQDIVIDNSRPWHNRVYIRHEVIPGKPKGAWGIDADTGERIYQGQPVPPVKSDEIAVVLRQKHESCISGTDGPYFAIVSCKGCKEGKEFVNAAVSTVAGAGFNMAAGAVAGLVKFGADAFSLVNAAADVSGHGASSGVKELLTDSVKTKAQTKYDIPIHDISGLPNADDIFWVGTPKELVLGGGFRTAHAEEQAERSAQGDSYTFAIDCYHEDGDPEILTTDDTITAEFWIGDQLVHSAYHRGDIKCRSGLKKWTNFVTPKLPSIPTKVVLKTDGEDALFIDQAKLEPNLAYNSGAVANLLANPGADNYSGWCLSQDTSDKFPKLGVSACRPSETFVVAGYQSNIEETCRNKVQGRVEWAPGQTRWLRSSLDRFCDGIEYRNIDKRIRCFENMMKLPGMSWEAALTTCPVKPAR